MTRFTDGPAKGQTLMLRRAPKFLRVAVSSAGKWDALDQLSDQPAAGEKLYAYALDGEAGMMHLRCARNRGGFYTMANYQLVPEQPDDTTMRETSFWRQWCLTYNPILPHPGRE